MGKPGKENGLGEQGHDDAECDETGWYWCH